MPPGTLPPVVLPYDPTSTHARLPARPGQPDPERRRPSSTSARYEVRPQIMSQPGAIAPLVYGGKVRAVMMLPRPRRSSRPAHLSPLDVMKAVDDYNVFLPTGSAKFGDTDYAIDSNSMFDLVGDMGEIPLRNEHGNAAFLRDVATPKDANYIQTNVVRVNGRRQVYIPVFRQLGASTLRSSTRSRRPLETMKARLTRPGIDLKVVMDQSVYVRQSIESLVEEGVLGAVLCSLVILLFLGEWRMTAIAVLTIPIAVLAALVGLYAHGQHDQRHDAGRPVAGDRPAGRQRHHLPGEHAPAPRPRRHPGGGRLPRGQRGRHARAGGEPAAPSWCSPRWP